LRHDNKDKECCQEASTWWLIKVFLSEYYATIISLAMLSALFLYAVAVQRVFDFMLFVAVWLQLELAYRQWWLEARSRGPRLEIADLEIRDNTLLLSIRNTGRESVYGINVPVYVIPLEKYSQLASILRPKTLLAKHCIRQLEYCAVRAGGTYYELSLLPGNSAMFQVELKELAPLIFNSHGSPCAVMLVELCRGSFPLSFSFSECDEYAVLAVFERYSGIGSKILSKEDIPGMLMKIPNMLNDIQLCWQHYRHLLRARTP
jgi:hypothetical protein